MEKAIRAVLLASSGVTALVGTRVNWGEHPQGAGFPAIVLTVISNTNQHTMSGPDKLFEARVQVDCYATSYGAVKALAQAVIAALDGYSSGKMQGIFHAGSRDGREGGSNEATRPFRVSIDFMTQWSD